MFSAALRRAAGAAAETRASNCRSSARSIRSRAKGSWYGIRSVALHRVGVGEQVAAIAGTARATWHQVARGRVVAEGQERQRTVGPVAGGDEGGERRIGQAVELAGRHVALARRVVVDRVVETVEDQQLAAEPGVELLVAHPLLDVLGGRRALVFADADDVPLSIKAIDPVDPLGVHQIRGVPAARGVEDDVVRPRIPSRFRRGLRPSPAEIGRSARRSPGRPARRA